ncbi:MAG: hypothetical protein AB7R40_26250 [Nitrospiraceae bacterium]
MTIIQHRLIALNPARSYGVGFHAGDIESMLELLGGIFGDELRERNRLVAIIEA